MLLTADGALSANPRSLSGVVQTGGTSSSQPLPNVNVTLFEATLGRPTALGHTTTDAAGRFAIPYKKNRSSSIFFVNADVGEGVEFVTVLGPNLPASVTINELTTVAASYSMAQFLRTGVISGNSFGLQIAAGMNDNIVALRDRSIVSRLVEFSQCRPKQFTALYAIARESARGVRKRSRCDSEPFRFDHAARRSAATQYC